MVKGQVSNIESNKRKYEKYKNSSDEVKARHKENQRQWVKKNRAMLNKKNRERKQHMKEGAACEIIKQHHEDMKDDPERLTTEFMKNIVNIECDD